MLPVKLAGLKSSLLLPYTRDALDESDERNQPGYREDGGSDGDGGPGQAETRRDIRPPQPSAEVATRCTAAGALAWLFATATDPHREPTQVRQCFRVKAGGK